MFIFGSITTLSIVAIVFRFRFQFETKCPIGISFIQFIAFLMKGKFSPKYSELNNKKWKRRLHQNLTYTSPNLTHTLCISVSFPSLLPSPQISMNLEH